MFRFLSFIICLGSLTALSQPGKLQKAKRIDSLKTVIKTSEMADSALIDAYVTLSDLILRDDRDSALNLLLSAEVLTENRLNQFGNESESVKTQILKDLVKIHGSIKYLHQHYGEMAALMTYNLKSIEVLETLNEGTKLGETCISIGDIYLQRGNAGMALIYYDKARVAYDSSGDERGMVRFLNKTGHIYKQQGNFSQTLINYKKVLELHVSMENEKGIANSFDKIARVYLLTNQTDSALFYAHKALGIRSTLNDRLVESIALNLLGEIHYKDSSIDSTLVYYNHSVEVLGRGKHPKFISGVYQRLGNLYQDLTQYDKALQYYQKGLGIRESIGFKSGMEMSYRKIAELNIETGRFSDARLYAHKAMDIAKSFGYPALIEKNANLLSLIAEKEGNYEQALKMRNLQILMRDSIVSKTALQESANQLARYEYEKQAMADSLAFVQQKMMDEMKHQSQLDKAASQRKILYAGVLFLALIGFSIFIAYRRKQKDNVIIRRQKQEVEAEKERSDELLLNILPEETAKELKMNGFAKARNYDLVTVLFTDFKGFTMLSEELSPVELVAEIDYCYKAFDEIMERCGIEKIKTIGDAYMAAGGLPGKNQTNPVDTVKAALEIRDFMLNLKTQREQENRPVFEIRIGVHTGPVVAGIVGIKKFAYDIWGDTVNTASRMESSGAVGKVNVSETTYAYIKDSFICQHRGKVEAKNKGKIDMYFVDYPG